MSRCVNGPRGPTHPTDHDRPTHAIAQRLLSSYSCFVPAETAPIRDPTTLRAFAHPVRMRLYEALLAQGPSTASQLAREVPGAPGSLSYHLRTLARHGFVEEAPELASDGRERWWRAVSGGARWAEEDLNESPGMREAATSAQLMFLARQQDRLRDWLQANDPHFGPQWRSVAVSSDLVLHLSSDELGELGRDLEEVTDRWMARSRENRASNDSTLAADEDRSPVFVVVHAFPFSITPDGAALEEPDPPGAVAPKRHS